MPMTLFKSKILPKQSPQLVLSLQRRWVIYVIGVLETLIFSGCIFGWGQLVFVLKNEGIFSDLCSDSDNRNRSNSDNRNASDWNNSNFTQEYFGCEKQDQKFALINTITSMVYAAPQVFVGLMIHHWGLSISRITAGIMLVLGFTGLGFTTKENSGVLEIAMILIALGGNQLRLSGLQFCNLFPRYRSTALTIISGSYATSAGVFMIFQFGQASGISLWSMSICLASLAALSTLTTVLMPWHHIPYEDPNKSSVNQDWRKDDISLVQSFVSISSITHSLWMILIMTGIVYFNTSFNSWISRISSNNEEAGHFTLLYGVAAFACPLVSPLPGILTDYMSKRGSKEVSFEDEIHRKLKSPVAALIIVTCLSMFLQFCMIFNHYLAVYFSLLALICVRPSLVAVGCDFLRIRFPPYHFYRVLGMYGTLMSILSVIQYPIFLWSQIDHLTATIFFIFLISVTFTQPMHLLSKKYRQKIIRESMKDSGKEGNFLMK